MSDRKPYEAPKVSPLLPPDEEILDKVKTFSDMYYAANAMVCSGFGHQWVEGEQCVVCCRCLEESTSKEVGQA